MQKKVAKEEQKRHVLNRKQKQNGRHKPNNTITNVNGLNTSKGRKYKTGYKNKIPLYALCKTHFTFRDTNSEEFLLLLLQCCSLNGSPELYMLKF